MNSNEHPSGKPSGRTIIIHVTRDMMMLVCALVFLIIAILLVVIVPSAKTTDTVAIGAMERTLQPQATTAPTAAATVAPAPPVSVAQAQPQGYPVPQAVVSASAANTGYPAPQTASGSAGAALTFIPNQQNTDPTQQPTEEPPFVAVSPDTPRSPTLPADGAVQPTAAVAPPAAAAAAVDPKIKPQQSADKLAAPPADGGSPLNAPAVPKPRHDPVTVLRGPQHWTTGPVKILHTYRLLSSATLTIDPGVEVQFAPGASLSVEGTLFALGSAERPIRFIGMNGNRWESIVGAPGSNIDMNYVDIQNGGAGGTLIRSESGNLVIHNGHIIANGGHIVATNSRVDIRNTYITGNDMPYGSAIEIGYTGVATALNGVVLNDNRVQNNHLAPGTVPVQISNDRPDSIVLDVQRNLLINQDGPNVILIANSEFQGNFTCNALVGGTNGLSVHSNQPQTFSILLNIRDNAIESHMPPLDPFYRQNHIGRGASSEIPLTMENNWWGNPSGPYVPDRHADGRGDAVGANIAFDSWQTARPACAPMP